ncbi:MAG: NAD(P)H-dependent oxidoreductase [Alphaproteobacteria bacterium]|nr:NAD(P)H-dependent oxidoreductase [Alphaproteobacteria bacterium]MDE2042527.1 NAD(P)H-dependent oxidoreductase [Alphaproteobacteria bacterium]MDE2340019.1 NAD(P)H-dependent oxidoreductase [Alphaproteobacteria bacterium]
MSPADDTKPLIIGIGGTFAPTSSTEQALRIALDMAGESGARTMVFGASALVALAHYGTPDCARSDAAAGLVAAIRAADGLIIASPGYHGTISGLVKNAVDYIEETARDPRPYLDGLPVGLIATAFGWQAAVSTLNTLRTIVHALRGWPTPLGVAINSSSGPFRDGLCVDEAVTRQLGTLGQQVVDFAQQRQQARPR